MTNKLASLRRRLARVKPWVAVAALVAIVLVGYYFTLGIQYWVTSNQITSMSSQISHLSLAVQGEQMLPDEQKLKEELAYQEGRLEDLGGPLSGETDALVAAVSSIAREARVGLSSVAMGDLEIRGHGDIQYRVQPMSVALKGQRDAIYSFLSLFSQEAGGPIANVAKISMSDIDKLTSAQVQLLIYLAPEGTSGEEEAE